jgi:hypothetical protein
MDTGVLARMATTGIYLVSGVSRDLQRADAPHGARESLGGGCGGKLDT